MDRHVLVLRSHRAHPADLGDLLRDHGTSGIWEVSAREWRAYFPAPDPDLAQACGRRFPDVAGRWEVEASVDWAARYQASLKPIRVGRHLVVLPSPEISNPWSERLPLHLVPGTAFGTGEHYTTRSCLEVLELMAPIGAPVLDVGCGSGVLSVAALLLGAPRAVACDVDPEACKVAAATARANGVGYRILAGSADAVRGTFGLVLANILAETLVEILPDLHARLAPGAHLVGSGIMLRKGDVVLKRAQALGLRLDHRRTDGEWWTFRWRRELSSFP